jgi:hypothetical protein
MSGDLLSPGQFARSNKGRAGPQLSRDLFLLVLEKNMAIDIEQSATDPKSVSGDSGSVEQHSLADQIAADKYLASKVASKTSGIGGIKLVKLMAPGAV